MKLLCRHCGLRPRHRAGGLCVGCYAKPGVREGYLFRAACRGYGLGNHRRELPPAQTFAAPGSAEKIEVLSERAASGLSLWHPRDAVGDSQ